jgi:hypothetical protein
LHGYFVFNDDDEYSNLHEAWNSRIIKFIELYKLSHKNNQVDYIRYNCYDYGFHVFRFKNTKRLCIVTDVSYDDLLLIEQIDQFINENKIN